MRQLETVTGGVLIKFRKFHKKTLVLESLFNKVARKQPPEVFYKSVLRDFTTFPFPGKHLCQVSDLQLY